MLGKCGNCFVLAVPGSGACAGLGALHQSNGLFLRFTWDGELGWVGLC